MIIHPIKIIAKLSIKNDDNVLIIEGTKPVFRNI